jgi:hypothetical protein
VWRNSEIIHIDGSMRSMTPLMSQNADAQHLFKSLHNHARNAAPSAGQRATDQPPRDVTFISIDIGRYSRVR